jgi:hypothetical protein
VHPYQMLTAEDTEEFMKKKKEKVDKQNSVE